MIICYNMKPVKRGIKMSDFKVIETQEQFDEAIKKRIEQAERTTKETFKDFLSPEDVQKLKDDFSSKLKGIEDKSKKDIDDLKKQMATDADKLKNVSELEEKVKSLQNANVHQDNSDSKQESDEDILNDITRSFM